MNVKTFIQKIQEYYNLQYPIGTGEVLTKYLATWTEPELAQLAALTIKTYSGRYGRLPDIAVFEELKPEVLEIVRYLPQNDVKQIEDKSEYASPEEVQKLLDHFNNTIFKKGEFA